MAIKIFTRDNQTIIQYAAVKEDGTAYSQSEISQIRMFRKGPRNDPTSYPILTGAFTTGNAFEVTISGTLPIVGFWAFDFEYTLTGTSTLDNSQKVYYYVDESLMGSTTASTSTDAILLESGDRILLESGDLLLLESGSSPPSGDSILLESGDILLLESGDRFLLE